MVASATSNMIAVLKPAGLQGATTDRNGRLIACQMTNKERGQVADRCQRLSSSVPTATNNIYCFTYLFYTFIFE